MTEPRPTAPEKALAIVADTLSPFSLDERRRILAAAAALLGQDALAIAILEAPGSETNGGDASE